MASTQSQRNDTTVFKNPEPADLVNRGNNIFK